MRHFLLITIFLCGVVSCLHTRKTTTQKTANSFSPALYGFEKDSLCQALVEDVKQHWRYDTLKKIYHLNKFFLSTYVDCFKQMDTTQCKQLLGKYNSKSPAELQYYISSQCVDDPFQNSCRYVCIGFDRLTGKIITVGYCAISGNR